MMVDILCNPRSNQNHQPLVLNTEIASGATRSYMELGRMAPYLFGTKYKVSLINGSLECGHSWCLDCTSALFIESIYTPSLMPIACCATPIDPNPFKWMLMEDVMHASSTNQALNPIWQLWKQKSIEFATENPIYCRKRSCSEWIDLGARKDEVVFKFRDNTGTLRDILTCSKCKTDMCSIYYMIEHDGAACVQNEQDYFNRRVLNMIKTAPWISKIIGVPPDGIVKGTLGWVSKERGVVGKVLFGSRY